MSKTNLKVKKRWFFEVNQRENNKGAKYKEKMRKNQNKKNKSRYSKVRKCVEKVKKKNPNKKAK